MEKILVIKLQKKLLFSFYIGLAILSACSKKPDQYKHNDPKRVSEQKRINNFYLYQDPAKQTIGKKGKDEQKKRDELTNKVSLKDIIYGVGAAGINFQTSFSQSINKLSEIMSIKNDAHYYKAGAVIYWREIPPRTPTGITLLGDYKGKLKVGGNIGAISVGLDMSKHFINDDQTGKSFIKSLYRILEKKDPDYDCLLEATCNIKAFTDYLLFHWPKFGMLLSRDRKIVADIRLWHLPPAGILDNEFDIIKNTISKNGEILLTLGDNFNEISEKLNQTPIEPNSTFFKHDYGLSELITSKSQYNRLYIHPNDSETIQGISYYTGYLKQFKINGQYLIANKVEDGYSFNLSDSIPDNDKDIIGLNHKTKIIDQKEIFFIGLSKTLKNQFAEIYPNVMISTQGLYGLSYEQRFNTKILSFDPENGKGEILEFQMARNTGYFENLYKDILIEEIDKHILPYFKENITIPIQEIKNKKYDQRLKSLYGFKIGGLLRLTNIDYGRMEATVQWLDDNKHIIASARSIYNEEDILLSNYDNDGKILAETVQSVNLSTLDINLKIKKLKKDYIIVGIESSNFNHKITGLCGSQTPITINSKKSSVKKIIFRKILTDLNRKDCPTYNYINNLEDGGEEEFIFFPRHNISLRFYENELRSINIYSSEKEGDNENI